ncbi:MAG: DUF6493 family protein [Bacteroidota bacterium]|nr:DUF6493 family protein [Bacteroidota bacterium]
MKTVPAVEEFEQIIRHQGADELVPFLLALEKRDVVAVREKLLNLKKELESVVQLTTNSWGSRGTPEQFGCTFLAGLAVFSRRELLSNSFRPSWELNAAYLNDSTRLREHFLHLVRALRPDWLGEWLHYTHEKSPGWAVNYALLRTMEEEQLISYSPALNGRSVVQTLYIWGNELSNIIPTPLNAVDIIADKIRNNSLLLIRDLPLLFELASSVDAGYSVTIQPMKPLDAKGIRSENGEYLYPWQVWDQKYPPVYVTWQDVIINLTATNHLDRVDILTRCLLALRRDFRRPLLTWFRNLFLALQPTQSERLTLQNELLELLPQPQPLVANFALEQLKDLLAEPGFAPTLLLPYADGLFLRPDLKTGLRKLLAALLKLPKQEAAHAPAVARLLAAALPHPDGFVQERAAQGLAGLLKAKQPLLTTGETAAAAAAITSHADLLGAPARTVLAAWLAPVAPADTPAEMATYAPAAQFVPELSAATAIEPVADWHELLFLTGQVLRHHDPAATERWLDGLLRLNGQWPAGFAGQLRPYLAQLFPEIKKASEAEVAAILREPVDVYGHEGLVQALLLTWATDFAVARVAEADLKRPHAIPHPLLTIEKQRYLLAESLLRTRQALPLLSTPTHQPHWVAPSALVARLLAYQAAGIPPEPADLAVALARTAYAHPTTAAAALTQLPNLVDTGLRELLTWFLGPADAELPALRPATRQRTPAGIQAPLAEAMPELWAVAARTKAPLGRFPTLPTALGYDFAGVAQPLRSAFEAIEHENRYPDPEQPGQTKSYRFVELAWDSGAVAAPPSPLLLYAPPVGKSEYGSWEQNSVMADDFRFLLALIPQHAAPLYDQILRTAAWADNLEASERNLVALGLQELLIPGPTFGMAETALLASGLVHHTPLCRSLAQEVLVRAVTQARLVPGSLGRILGRQLAIGYAPVPRLTANLELLLAIDAATDDALRQVFDSLLSELPAEAPRNSRKLLEMYARLVGSTRRAVPAAVQARLREWQAAGSLKKAATSLLA